MTALGRTQALGLPRACSWPAGQGGWGQPEASATRVVPKTHREAALACSRHVPGAVGEGGRKNWLIRNGAMVTNRASHLLSSTFPAGHGGMHLTIACSAPCPAQLASPLDLAQLQAPRSGSCIPCSVVASAPSQLIAPARDIPPCPPARCGRIQHLGRQEHVPAPEPPHGQGPRLGRHAVLAPAGADGLAHEARWAAGASVECRRAAQGSGALGQPALRAPCQT